MASPAPHAGAPQFVDIDGNRLKLTNLDKVMYPHTGTTKGDVIAYYAEIAEVMLSHVRNRPVTRKRWVHGVGTEQAPEKPFFQKHLDDSAPQWVSRREIEHSDHANLYPLANDRATLTWLAQIGSLEIHVPQWQFGRTGVKNNPDRMVLDLDPGPGMGLGECAEVARLARAILEDMALTPMPVTSGSKGIHLYAALDGTQSSEQVSAVAKELARALEADNRELVVSDMKKSLRTGRVLVDWSQNNANKTTIAPYSLRGRAHPTVAAPRTWRELSSKQLEQLDYKEVLRRVKRRGDPLAALAAGHLASLEPTREHMARFDATPAAEDRLAKYRSMRDRAKTPEPVPEAVAAATPGRSFVIQEHHARRLHFDFRLEHDGVLVSWAVPKGMPTDQQKNHLAVQTEDHPLEYGTFEGNIPAGEYGAGEVTIWDSGQYELEKWREAEEVIVTIHGEKYGSHRYALIHTEGTNWLMHLTKTQPKAGAELGRERRDATERERQPTPSSALAAFSPMLATSGSESELRRNDERQFAYEMKWDGIRALAVVSAGTVRLVSRNGNDVTGAYPELAEIAERTDGDGVLDGEIVAINREVRPDFGLLQTRMKLTRPADVARAARTTPVHFMVFDVLQADLPEGAGAILVDRSYDERRAVLERLVSPGGAVQVPPAFPGNVEAAMESSRQLGLEGVIAKRRDSTYASGRRSRAWLKLKHHLTQEVVIGGWRPGKGRRANGIGSLLMGVPHDGGLHYVGRVGTGFSDADLDALGERLTRLERKTSPFEDIPRAEARDAHWIRPALVGEVEFSEWTQGSRLRQPSWRGLRPDKNPSEVSREEKEVAQ